MEGSNVLELQSPPPDAYACARGHGAGDHRHAAGDRQRASLYRSGKRTEDCAAVERGALEHAVLANGLDAAAVDDCRARNSAARWSGAQYVERPAAVHGRVV